MKNIFISSTFIDMQAERDMVQERVLPALREEARKYGDNVGVIDLRWGVDTSTLETEEGAAKVLKVCLDEIDRSHPYMLIFLGERYGTMMREEQIAKSVYGREDKYTTDDYVKSITALEVEYGALSEKYGELNHCVVCFREPVVHMLDGVDKDLYSEHTDEGRRKLEALKERIKSDLGDDDRLITYSCTWNKFTRQLVDFTSDGQPLENVLTNCFVEMFRDDWKEYENLSWQDKEQLSFRALMESKLHSFVGREALLEEYYQSVVNATYPIILQGEVGSGKTAIMCKLVDQLQKEGKNVFKFFSGTGSISTNAESLVKQMVYYMEKLLGIEEHFGAKEVEKDKAVDVTEKILRAHERRVQYDEWMDHLGTLCSQLPEEEKVYFCIDAMDQLFLDEHVEKLDFFPRGKGAQVIASCTNEFTLPMEVIVNREIKQIPVLSEEDAKTVAEGILASYSRNAYAAIEEEILKKKSIGKPLYISLLIQRLNMMDIEELQKAMSEEEIIVLGTRIINEMPDELEEAIVAVIRNGIDKLSEIEDVLYDVLEYLAVSRNGLRMSDLQEIFVAKGKSVPTLDFTLLIKYLDGFFYVHEDGRIDFTHKVIRQGLLKGLGDKQAKAETIKEHLKTMAELDVLRIREGMYFARICKDVEFAKELIVLEYLSRNEELIKEIKNEAVTDGGDFYCRLIEKEDGEKSIVRDFFLWMLPKQFGATPEEIKAILRILKAIAISIDNLYEKLVNDSILRDLLICYEKIGNVLSDIGRSGEALPYYEKSIKWSEALYKKSETDLSLRDLSIGYESMSCVLLSLGQAREALSYSNKAIKCREALYNKLRNDSSLRDLSISYNNAGNVLKFLGQMQEALSYYKEALKYSEDLYKKSGSYSIMRELANGYNHVSYVLESLGQVSEALSYSEKCINCREYLYKKTKSDSCLQDLAGSYDNMGDVLIKLGRREEALVCYETSLRCREDLHKKLKNELSKNNLAISFDKMGNTLKSLGRIQEALLYCKEAIKYFEDLYKKSGSYSIMRELAICYESMSAILDGLGKIEEALLYCEKVIKYREYLYNECKSYRNLQDLAISYYNMCYLMEKAGLDRQAQLYCEKVSICAEILRESFGSDSNM